MGSCERSVMVDDAAGKSVIEQHRSEFPVRSVPVEHSCSEVACNMLDSNVDLSNILDGCKDFSTNEESGSASCIDLRDISSYARTSECANADMLLVEKTLDDDSQNCFSTFSGQCEVSNLENGGLCSEEKPLDYDDAEMPSEFISVNVSRAGDTLVVVEEKNDDDRLLTDAGNRIFDFGHSELSLQSEPMTSFLVNCHKKNQQEDILRNRDSLEVVDNCNAFCGMDTAVCKGISPAQDSEVPSDAIYTKGDALCGIEVAVCNQISPSQASEVSSDALYTETGSTSDQLHDQKDGEDCNSPYEEKVEDFVDKRSIIDTYVQVLSPPACQRILGSSTVAYSLSEALQLEQGINKSDIVSYADVTEVLEQNVDVINEINFAMKDNVLQIEGNSCNLKDNSPETSANCTFSFESYLPSIVSFSNSPSKVVPDVLLKDNNCSISYNSAVCNSGQNDYEGKDIVKVDCVTESKCSEIVLLPAKGNSRRRKSGRKPQTKRASRKCNKQANVPQLGWGMKTFLMATRKKRSCFSKPARSSVWGLLDNIKQFFEQHSELGVNEAIGEGYVKEWGSGQSGKINKNAAKSSSLSSMLNCGASATRFRLKIKVGKGFDLSCPNVLVSEGVDGASCLGPGGSQKLAGNTGDKLFEDVAMGKFESYKYNLDKDADVLIGQIANNHSKSATLTKKSDGDAEELCLAVPSKRLVDTLIEPVNIKGVDPGTGTSPASEVIDSIPEVLVEERHEGLNDTDCGSSKEFNFAFNDTTRERGKKKDKLTCSNNCSIKDGSQGPPRKNKAKYPKNHQRKKNFTNVVSSMELPTLTDINTLSNSVSCGELHKEPLCISGESGLGNLTDALEVKGCKEDKTHCSLDVGNGNSESPGVENFLSPERHLGCKLPKSLKTSKVSKTMSKASESKSRKGTTCRRGEELKIPVNESDVKGRGVADEVKCEIADHLHTEHGIDGEHNLDSFAKINTDSNIVSFNLSNLDMVPGVGFGEQNLLPRNAWVRCDDCHKWRRIPAALADLIEETNCTWTCKESDDKAFADCSIAQEKSNAEINAELGLSDASGEEDAYEDCKNYKELEQQRPMFPQESTFIGISTNEFLHRSRKTQTIDEVMVCHCKPPPKGQLGCGDECLNRMLNIECVQGACPCGDICSNQQFQKCNYARLKWFKCGKKGYGLKALEDISEGQFLIEYVGEVLDVHAYEARQREYALKGHRHFYFMTLNGSEVIDASAKGNLGRFINHSCDPNCRTEKWMVNGEICIGLFALRDIKQDEEVTFDYNYVRVFGAAAKRCYCASPQCRGYIGGDLHNAEIIVQGDSDEEFPEPVMLTEDGKIDDGSNGSPEMESSLIPASATSQLHRSLEVEDSKGNLLSSVQVKELSQQMVDVTSKPLPVVQKGYAVESELSDKTSLITKLETSSTSSVSKSKSETIEDRYGPSELHLLVKTSRINGSVKKGKVRANPPNGLKAEATTIRLQVPSIKHKKVVEASSNGRFEAVEEKLKELLDSDGGISKSKDATKGYLKLLLLTVASGDRSNGEAIQSCSNRDLSMILGALMETRSRAVLNDIINKNGLRMLHNIMKQYRGDFKKIPILRKLLKVLERLAERKILTFEHINGGPPCPGMESFRQSMLSLTEHEDKEVHQIARSFRDRWIPRSFRKYGFIDRVDYRVESYRRFKCNRFSASPNYRCEQDLRPTEAIDCVQQSMAVTSSVNAGAQEGCSAPSLNGCEVNRGKRRKRKSRWDQPAETNSHIVSYVQEEDKVASGLSKQTDEIINSLVGRQNISEDVPPGFSCLFQPLGSLNASLNSGDLALQNASHSDSGCPSDVVIAHPKEKFNSRLHVSYGVPWPVIQQYGTPHAETADSWVTAPGMPFNPFPPLPPDPPQKKDCQSSNATDAMKIDQPAEVVKRDTSGLGSCYSDDMIPCTTDADAGDFSYENNNYISKRLKSSPSDLGRSYFRQQKWNKSKIPRPWSRRNLWGCNESNSRGNLCSIGVVDVPEDAICKAEKDGNNI